MDNPEAPAVLMRPDAFPWQLTHPVGYFEGVYGMILLREQILCPDRFDRAFRKYIRDWAYKHPSPSDFFRAMEIEAGEDLSWFWRGWNMNNWKYDVAVDHVDGSRMTISNRGQLVLPASVLVEFNEGSDTRLRVPVEAWLSKGTFEWTPPSGKTIVSVVADPDHVLPDDDRSNNERKVQ